MKENYRNYKGKKKDTIWLSLKKREKVNMYIKTSRVTVILAQFEERQKKVSVLKLYGIDRIYLYTK